MTRILLRAHKNPFRVASPETTLSSNLIGDNSGNLIFAYASYKLLATRGNEVTTALIQTGREDAAQINDEHDVLVLPLANAFRPSFQVPLDRLAALIEQLTIPVVVLGVGAQMHVDGSFERLGPMREISKRFVSAVLERSPSIGVRGEHTYNYLTSLGYSDIDLIGCPSLFMQGPRFRVDKPAQSLTPESKLAINVSPYVDAMGPVIRHHLERYPELRYIAQDKATLQIMLEGAGPDDDAPISGPLPTYPEHPLFTEQRTRIFVDTDPWLDYLSDFDFSFGTRIHGNIASLLAGTPSYLLAHDSRTLELAEYFELPHRTMKQVTADMDAADLYAEADYSAFNAGHEKRFTTFTDFLTKHGLRNVFGPGEDPTEFDRRMAATRFPAGVGEPNVKRSVGRRAARSLKLRRASK